LSSHLRKLEEILLGLVEKTMITYLHATLVNCFLAICTFNLWKVKGMHDALVIVVNFISNEWKAKHVIIRLFEVMDISDATMAPKLQKLLDRFSLTHKIMVYVKDERSNLQTCANALTSITSCTNLVLLEPFDGSYLGHAFPKFCQYTITHEKMFVGLPFASIKVVQSTI